MDLDSLTLGDIKKLKYLLGSTPAQSPCEEFKGKKIIIQQRGWVFVGDLYQKGDDCTLKNAANIRVWGTTKGLGEIATGGPTKDTKLDPCPDVHFHYLTMIAAIDVMDEKMEKITQNFGEDSHTSFGSSYGSSYGYGSGDGNGYGDGYGNGNGYGNGYGYGYGNGSGYGYGYGYGYGNGSGDGYGYGNGNGNGYGYGNGSGDGNGVGF